MAVNLQGYKFFDQNSTERVSNILGNPNSADTLTLEVNDFGANIALSVRVECLTDLNEQDNWHEVSVISLENYKVSKKITKAGLYMIPFSGISRCRLVSENDVGDFKIFGILTAG